MKKYRIEFYYDTYSHRAKGNCDVLAEDEHNAIEVFRRFCLIPTIKNVYEIQSVDKDA